MGTIQKNYVVGYTRFYSYFMRKLKVNIRKVKVGGDKFLYNLLCDYIVPSYYGR